MLRHPCSWLVAVIAISAHSPAQEAAARVPAERSRASESVRGITVSTHGIGREWARESVMRPTFEKIAKAGASWVALHPYGRIHADGRVTWSFRRGRRRSAEERAAVPDYWTAPIRFAHARGLKILIKPHLAYWGSPFSWRGEIAFRDKEQWARFFASYSKWIVLLARACRSADGFCVGTELDRTLGHEKEWRALIARVRAQTRAPLTYAANWSDYRRVPFWDAVDVIGIQAYFPLTDTRNPGREALDAAWAAQMREMRRYSKQLGRKIVFTELGYNRSLQAAAKPWEYRTDGPEASPLQHRCLAAALAAVESEPSVIGAFLWKWFPEPRPVGRNFQLATPPILEVIRDCWPRGRR